MPETTREFDTGANRDTETGKYDYEGFLSPVALEVYAQYMHRHRHLADGTLRDSDNWQKGMPLSAYMKSLWRHLITAWRGHRKFPTKETMSDALCGIMFNAMGYLHELHKDRGLPMTEKYRTETMRTTEAGTSEYANAFRAMYGADVPYYLGDEQVMAAIMPEDWTERKNGMSGGKVAEPTKSAEKLQRLAKEYDSRAAKMKDGWD